MINNGENTFYKQMSQQTATPPAPSPIQNMSFAGSGLNDAVLGGAYNQITIATIVVTISANGTPDQFDWVETGGSGSSGSGVNITGAAQALVDGITVRFPATTGHHIGDAWTIVAIPTAREFWSATGIKKVIWTDGSVVTMSGAGGAAATVDLTAPGPIGSGTRNTGTFTSVTAGNDDSGNHALKIGTGIANLGEISNFSVFGTTGYGLLFTAANTTLNAASGVDIRVNNNLQVSYDGATIANAKPVLLEPLTTTQRDALTPSEGWMIYNSTTHKIAYYNGSTWIEN